MCFGCGVRGGLQTLASRQNREVDGVQIVLQSYESTANAPYIEPKNFSELAKTLRRNLLSMHPPAVVEYIVGRHLDPLVSKHFGLGWKEYGGCIAMPYYDDEIVPGIKYRPKSGPKFMEDGSRRILYNIDDLRGRPYVVLGEGESDAHALWSVLRSRGDEWGIGAIPGASMTRGTFELWALDIIFAKTVYLAYDADKAGDHAAEICENVLGDRAVRIRPTKGKDISDHLLAGGTLEEIGL